MPRSCVVSKTKLQRVFLLIINVIQTEKYKEYHYNIGTFEMLKML